jgi:hypothetical protein
LYRPTPPRASQRRRPRFLVRTKSVVSQTHTTPSHRPSSLALCVVLRSVGACCWDLFDPGKAGGGAADCEYGVSLKPSGAAKAGSPDCLAWPRGTARAFPVLPPDPVRRGDAGFGGRTRLARIDLIMEGPPKHGTRRRGSVSVCSTAFRRQPEPPKGGTTS